MQNQTANQEVKVGEESKATCVKTAVLQTLSFGEERLTENLHAMRADLSPERINAIGLLI